ncbi:MAG: ABC transporter ATP-binding protein [Selenomonadaceae bacterium]|nr:ABC transporter ATP-binding protein [Selenomonadaceae bacterium]
MIVRAERLTKKFLTATALDDISLTIKAGCLTALIGPDGAGKTTLMRLIAGLMMPTAGSIEVLGMPTAGNEQTIQSRISYMPQKFGLYEDLSIADNMNLYADLHAVDRSVRRERFERLLSMTGLTPFVDRLAGKLSGGMKQKLGLACTLVRSPELLLLDEPTVGVDPLSRRELWQIIKQLIADERLSVLVATAYMEEAERCEEVFVMNCGRVLMSGSPSTITAVARDRCYKLKTPAGVPTRILQSILFDDKKHVIDSVPEGEGVRFIAQRNVEREYFTARLGLTVERVEPRLEDGFMILLHAARSNATAPLVGLKQLSLRGDYRLSTEIDIEVRELVRRFGSFTAVDKTSFQVRRGEVFGLLGPNGAGKTTTFRMLCGLLPLTDGYLSVAGVNLRTARTLARLNIGYVAQKFSMYGNLTVVENLTFFGGVYGLSGRTLSERIAAVLDEFKLLDVKEHRAEDLPGGYKQRLSMAAALIHEPKILFLDEPTSGIDPLARRDFWRQITDLSSRGTTIIITTHFMEEAEYCDRMMIQDRGKLLVLGTPQEIRRRYGSSISTMNDLFISIVEGARAQ